MLFVVKVIKKVVDDECIVINKIVVIVGKFDDLWIIDIKLCDVCIFLGWYVFVMVWENGCCVVKFMWY